MFHHNIDTLGPNYEMNKHRRKILISNEIHYNNYNKCIVK